ncbi:MAG: S46 family peptidase [Bacteroidales bacterium]|nr:S46 family peptidase [Deltaproteobacteria bacterium]MBL7139141.1 S46 family peptidase [Bacteroidales bacterium]
MQAGNPPDEGMWLPILIERLNYVDMQKMGLHLTPEEIYSVNQSSLKDAIVGLSSGSPAGGGFFCTAEVVSDKGLIFTNHHCGYSAVQNHSTPEHDYLTDGFWARSMDEELPNERMNASFLVRIENVTDSIIPFLPDSLSESDRGRKVREISGRISDRASEDGKYECRVSSFYSGNEYYLFVFKTYKDVRLVGAPPSSIGKFGGDTDNWMWPRHTGDFTIFRIYADSANAPANFSETNVPLKPNYHLPISLAGVKKNDFAMIWGYPGSTSRYMTSYGIEYNLNDFYPVIIDVFGKQMEVMKARMDVDKTARIAYSENYAGLSNTWKNFIGQTRMLRKNKVIQKKQALEADFTKWVNDNSMRTEKYGYILTELKEGYENLAKVSVPFYYSRFAGSGLDIVGFANGFSGLKDQLEKKNKAAIEETIKNLRPLVTSHFKEWDFEIEKNTFGEMLKLYAKKVKKEDLPSIYATIEKDFNNDFAAFADKVYSTSVFATAENANAFLDKPSLKVFKKDLGWLTAQSIQEASGKYAGAYGEARTGLSRGNRLFIDGLRDMFPDKMFYPDANSTLRFTYGKVLDYFPADAVHYDYITTLEGVMEKEDPTNDEFIVDEKLKALYEAKDYGPYGENGELVVCFLTTNDITGGNSGSPVINGDGQLIGLAFDGNWEAMSGDILFEDNLQRCINVDIRYVLFIIDKFANATNIIDELTIVK